MTSSEDFLPSIPKSIDYTSRDFLSIRNDLIQRIKDTGRLPNWVGEDPADFGVVLVETFAYLGDLTSYYTDRIANETIITTAVKPSSVLALAESYGYKPAGYRQATVSVSITNESEEPYILPEGTIFSGESLVADTVNEVFFTSTSEITIAAGDTEQVDATHGKNISQYPIALDNPSIDATYGELLAISSGSPNMLFQLTETPIVEDSIKVYVKEGSSYTEWTKVNYLIDYGPTDLIYTTFFTDTNTFYIQFGDGISGAIPALGTYIQASYTVGGGIIGNISENTLNEIVYIPGVVDPTTVELTVTNLTDGVGGFNPETLEQIRELAPLSYRVNSRAVTLQDFESLAISVPNVGKAKALGTSPTAVTLYIAPTRTATDADANPGLYNEGTVSVPNWQPTQELIDLKISVENYLSDKVLIGTTVTVGNPTYLDFSVALEYLATPQYETEDISALIKKTLFEKYNYEFRTFGETIYPQDIELVLNSLPSIRYAKVTSLFKGAGSGLNTIVADPDEIFRLQVENITVTEA